MAGVSTPGGDGLNVDVNVVPFIDLLSALVLFLLVGAVWVQIASMQAAVESKNGARSLASNEPPKRVEVRLTAQGYSLKWPAKAGRWPASIGLAENSFDREGLLSVVSQALAKEAVNAGAVSATDDVGYGQVVRAIDALKEAGLPNVALSTE